MTYKIFSIPSPLRNLKVDMLERALFMKVSCWFYISNLAVFAEVLRESNKIRIATASCRGHGVLSRWCVSSEIYVYTVQCCVSAVYAVFVCLCVCVSVCLSVWHTPVLYQNGKHRIT